MRFDRLVFHGAAMLGVAGAMLISGCVNTPKPAPQDDRIQTSPAATISYDRDPVLDLLGYARQLREAKPGAREKAVGTARARANAAPSAISYARLALAFGTPDQRRYTPDEAARYARRALNADNAQWSPAAKQYLDDLARLYAKAARPPQATVTTPPAATTASSAPAPSHTTTTIASDTPRVRALEQALDDAHRKLRELADIEEQLSESGS